MLAFLLFAVSPLLLHAQHNQQTPLQEDQHTLVIPLTLSDDRTYTFESALDGPMRLSSKAIAEIEGYREINTHPQNILIHIPLDAMRSGTMALDITASNNVRVNQDTEWTDTLVPGEHVPITHVGIRKGAMVSMDAYATRLVLETPYISLPNEIYDILILATNPAPHQHGAGYDDIVDCSHLDRYPDIVLGLQPQANEAEADEDVGDKEMVISPKQYVLRTEEGQCILLVKRNRAEVVLGWAAMRGRDVVLDWVNERTGFGR